MSIPVPDERAADAVARIRHELPAVAPVPVGVPALKTVLRLPVRTAEDRFLCASYRCDLAARVCVQRQSATEERRTGSHGRAYVARRVPGHLAWCASGKCAQGAAIRAAVGEVAAPRKQDQVAQLAARKAKARPKFTPPPTRRCTAPGCATALHGQARGTLCPAHRRVACQIVRRERLRRDSSRHCRECPTALGVANTSGLCQLHATRAWCAAHPRKRKPARVTPPQRSCVADGCAVALRSRNSSLLCRQHYMAAHQPAWRAARKAGAQ
jgi:hypothetical protein